MILNHILAATPSHEIDELRPHMILAPLRLRQVIHTRGAIVPDIVFIEQGIASLTVTTYERNGESEVGLIGREGLVGSSMFLQSDAPVPYQSFVQVAGTGYRVQAATLLGLLDRIPTLHRLCLNFINRLMAQTAQVAGCNVRHNVQERMARWLLMTRDRLDTDVLPITQEFLAVMLGVRSASVSLTASTLQTAGLIRQERGRIIILNSDGLSAASCRCYPVMKRLYESSIR